MSSPIFLPAAPGAVVYEITVAQEVGVSARPEAADVHAAAYAVVGWRIVPETDGWETATPILIDDPPHPETVWHLMPDGRLCLPFATSVENLEAAKAEVLQREQGRWDRAAEKAARQAAKEKADA
jgi:hypothetical protein